MTTKRLYISSLRFGPTSCKGHRLLDVVRLRALIAATKQEDQQLSSLDVINPVAGAEIDLHLDHASADASRLTGIPVLQPIDTRQNLRTTLLVSQAA